MLRSVCRKNLNHTLKGNLNAKRGFKGGDTYICEYMKDRTVQCYSDLTSSLCCINVEKVLNESRSLTPNDDPSPKKIHPSFNRNCYKDKWSNQVFFKSRNGLYKSLVVLSLIICRLLLLHHAVSIVFIVVLNWQELGKIANKYEHISNAMNILL